MGRFAYRQPGLQLLLPSSSAEIAEPNELSDVVTPVLEFPAPAARLQSSTRIDLTSAAALTPFLQTLGGLGPLAGQGEQYLEIWAAQISHNSAAAQVLTLSIFDPAGGMLDLCRLEALTPFVVWSVFAPAQSIAGFSAARPILVPPGWQIQLRGDAAAVAYQVTLSFVRMLRTLAERTLT